MAELNVTITLDEAALGDEHRLATLAARVEKHAHLVSSDHTMLAYGILMGALDADMISRLRAFPGVAAVEVDEQRHATRSDAQAK